MLLLNTSPIWKTPAAAVYSVQKSFGTSGIVSMRIPSKSYLTTVFLIQSLRYWRT